MGTLVWIKGSALPALAVWWSDSFGTLYDLSGATSFACKIGARGATPIVNKTTGITGAAGSGDGTAEADVPNVTVAWTDDDLDVTAGAWEMELSCLDGGLPRKLVVPFVIQSTFT